MDNLIIDRLVKKYDKHTALNGVSLEITPGMYGLLGPNGAGKTTLMRVLTTLLPATGGEIRLGSVNWKQADDVRRITGYLPQKFALYKHIRVEEVLDHVAVLKGVGDRKGEIETILEQVNLTEHRKKKMGQLSGGMVRRVGIAQALLGDPRIVVVDEPTAGLDPEERIRFRRLLRSLGRDKIVLISTHIVEDIEATCDRAAILYKGRLVEQGSIERLGGLATGKVWVLTVPQQDFYEVAEAYDVIASHRLGDRYRLRILADTPPPGAVCAAPTLEDGYLYAMRRDAS